MEHKLIPLREARERLRVSKVKMAELVRAHLFPVYENPLDRREKLVDWEEVQAALQRRVPRDIRDMEGKAAARISRAAA